MRLLLTGASGYAGRGLADVLSRTHQVRGFDLRPYEKLTDFITGDIADLDTCRRAVTGVDAVVFCHMAPNPTGYQTPELAVDVNVKGTANVYHAMAEQGIKRAVLISTGTRPRGADGKIACADRDVPGEGPYGFGGKMGMYVLTKVMQDFLARHYHDAAGIITTLLRPGWVVYDGTVTTKYGDKLEYYDPSLIDPRDIGAAVAQALELASPELEGFYIGQDDLPADLTRTHTKLKWRPEHRFESLKRR